MSVHETSAVWSSIASGDFARAIDAIPEDVLPAKRRSSVEVAVIAALWLADQYRPHRSYVDETNSQVAALLTVADARPALQTLHHAGVWVEAPGHRGRGRNGTRRVLGPILLAHHRDGLGGAGPAQSDERTRRDDEPDSAGSDTGLGGMSHRTRRGQSQPTPQPPCIHHSTTTVHRHRSCQRRRRGGGGGTG